MLSLEKANAPEAVLVDGAFYAIKTDFRYWITFSNLIRADAPLLTDFDFLYKKEIPEDRKAGLDALIEFYINRKELPRVFDNDINIDVISYQHDAELIYAAFLEQYGIDLFDEKTSLHWWKFKALLSALHGTKLNEVMGYRCYEEGDKGDWKKAARENKRRWEIPQTLTGEEKEAGEEFDRLLKKND